jgi:hypothetical protein
MYYLTRLTTASIITHHSLPFNSPRCNLCCSQRRLRRLYCPWPTHPAHFQALHSRARAIAAQRPIALSQYSAVLGPSSKPPLLLRANTVHGLGALLLHHYVQGLHCRLRQPGLYPSLRVHLAFTCLSFHHRAMPWLPIQPLNLFTPLRLFPPLRGESWRRTNQTS